MPTNAGIWVDHHKAVVLLLSDTAEETLLHFQAESDDSKQTPGIPREKSSYSRNDFVAEDKLQRKETAHLNHFYDQVIDRLRDVHEIVVLGPGEAKDEFRSRIERSALRGRVVEMRTEDKLTDHYFVEYVREYFHTKSVHH